jgi:protein-L-isoaspartate(D-aspartate) O-methyltransferase
LVRVLRTEGIRDRRVLAAFREVRRARLVPPRPPAQAYLDEPIRIPHGQVTTQPSLIASMVVALGLTGTERVLEIGTGLGFQTAILARLAGEVISVERFPALAEQAWANLAAAGLGHVTVVVGDGTLGISDYAPYQTIVVSAASPSVPAPLVGAHGIGSRRGRAQR